MFVFQRRYITLLVVVVVVVVLVVVVHSMYLYEPQSCLNREEVQVLLI